MNTETNNKLSGGKTTLIILAGIIIVFLVYYSIMSMMAPGRKLNELREKYAIKQENGNPPDEKIFKDSAFVSLMKEKAFLQSRIKMAETDSIYLTLNIADSTANLEICGVTVFSVKMLQVSTSSILSKGHDYIISSILSVPLNIVNDYSSFRKEPLMIKMAPKDTSEYKPDIIPDTTDYEPVNFILEVDNGIRIIVYQDENMTPSDRHYHFMFDLNDRLKYTWSSLKSVAKFKVPEYHPFIKIRLPKADAKIIYRAIPRKGQIAVYM